MSHHKCLVATYDFLYNNYVFLVSWFSDVCSAGCGSSGPPLRVDSPPPPTLRPLHGLGEDDEIDTSVSSVDVDYTDCLLQWYNER